MYDAYDQYLTHEALNPDDREAEWLNTHRKACPGGLHGLTREDGVPYVHRMCTECSEPMQRLYGVQIIRTPEVIVPDFDDPRRKFSTPRIPTLPQAA